MFDLTNYHHIHCIGIGGIGLSAIADVLLADGHEVSGSDMKLSDLTDRLVSKGATIYQGHSAQNIDDADLVVYSAAVSTENPELAEAYAREIPTATRAEVLGELMRGYRTNIAVSGTHGKTTTTSMISLVLEQNNLSPTILVGGVLEELGGNVKAGGKEYFITEACEYMDNFLCLAPQIEIILNIDSDHLDYFKGIDHIVRSFEKFASLVPEDGTVIAYSANPFLCSLIEKLKCNVITFGFDKASTYHAAHIVFNEFGMPGFDLFYGAEKIAEVQLAVPGEHNIANAMAAFACCHLLGLEPSSIVKTLESFTGTERRFQFLGETPRGARVVDDYAHHPTEIMATLKAAKNIPHKNLWCLFQPHTYTRTMALFSEFADAFTDADKIILAEIYAAREKNTQQISSASLAAEIQKRHPEKEVHFMATHEEILEFVQTHAEADDLILSMGAGDLTNLADTLARDKRPHAKQ